MASVEIKRDVEALIQDLMVKEGVKNYKIHFDGESEAGENYGGDILYVRVIPKEVEEAYNLVVKTAKRNKDLNKFMPVHLTYEREILMYSQVFPSYRKLIEETNSGLSLYFIPDVYLISDIKSKETIIFENLKSRGFKLHDKKKPWNMDHSLMAMKSYGELHAFSMALKFRKPEEYQKIIKQMPNITKELNKDMDVRAQAEPTVNNAMDLLRKHGRDDLVEKYDSLLDEIDVIVNHEVETDSDEIVIGHADCWNNNFLFQYQNGDESKPTSICLLDFQLSQLGSPVRDLSFNIYNTCDKSTLNHFETLLRTYHDSLSVCLRKLGCEPDNFFTFEQLKDHWKKYGIFGIVVALFILKLLFLEKDEVLDFTEISKNADNIKEFHENSQINLKNEEGYHERLLDILIHFGENFL